MCGAHLTKFWSRQSCWKLACHCPIVHQSHRQVSLARMSSFHNTQPRTREERLAAQNKEAFEKGRLKTRPGHGPKPDTGSPLVPDPTSPMYEANTFQRDVAGLIKQQKLQTINKQQVSVSISHPGRLVVGFEMHSSMPHLSSNQDWWQQQQTVHGSTI